MASRPLLSPLGEQNTLDPLSYERGGVNLALGRSSDTDGYGNWTTGKLTCSR